LRGLRRVSALDDVRLTLVESTEDVEDFLRWLGERRPILGVDSETTGLSLAKDRLRLVQFGDATSGWAIPHRDWRGLIRHVLEQYEGKMVLQHAKFDAGMFIRDGLPFPWERVHDTMIMNFLVDSLGPKSLKSSAARYVDPKAATGQRELMAAMAKHRWTWATVPIELPLYWGYAAMDTVLSARLAEEHWQNIQPYRAAYDLELACERVLCDMELRGVRVDVPYCINQRDDLHQELEAILDRLGDLNPNSTAQIVAALQATGVKLTKRTEKGNLSVDDEVLSEIAETNQTAADILAARTAQKLISSYFDNFLEYHEDGILHPHINQLAAKTGRMSVTEPALQTIPRKASVRDAFIPREGNVLLLIDYDNQELRVAADVSRDEAMIAAFERGEDLHTNTARALYGTDECVHDADLKCKHRTRAKNGMFAWAYGAGPPKFAATVKMELHEAEAVFATLRRVYPGMARAMQNVTRAVRARADKTGYGWIALQDGRHLRVSADKAYVGFNARIQGGCAVVLKQGLVDLDAAGLGEFVVLPVHDEFVLDVPADQVDEVRMAAEATLTRPEFVVPLTVSSKIVNRWGDAYRKEAA
jgi:DNA polymerase-1